VTTAALSKVVTAPNAAFSSDEIRAAGGPWKNFVLRVTAQNDTGSSAALEVKLADVITDIRLTNQGTLATSDSADFVTQVTGAEKPSNYAGTSITFLDYTNSFGITGNGFTKSANAGWGANLWTREYTVNSGFVSGEFIDHNTFMGLSNDGQAIDHFKSLEFALFADGGDRQVKVYESGTAVYNTGRSLTGVWAIAYDGVAVRYFCDGTLVYTSTKTIVAGWTMYAGFNAYDIGGSIKNVQFGIMGDQALAQLAINTIVNIASDNLITAGSEKRNLLDTYNRLSAETQRLIQESNSFTALYGDLTPTERTAAAAALKALKDYLDSLTPAWTTITANTVVDGPTLSARFKDLIDANLALQTANNIVLRKHADWDGVTGEGKDELIQQAADAYADAKQALSAIDIIQSDGYLSIDEKPTIVRLFDDIKNEQAGLIAQAQSIGVSSAAGGPIATYAAAYRDLYDYLTGLTPAYNNPTLPTTIVGATFNGKFSDYYYARTALTNATAAKAATIATWTGVTGSGKPSDNADVTGNNTSKDTNAVGGRPSTDVISQIDKTVTLTDLTPPATPTGLSLTSTVKANPDGAQVVTLVATWNAIPTPKNALAKYVLAIKEGIDGGYVEFEVGATATRYERVVPANVTYVAKVKAFDRNNNPSNFSNEVTYTTVKDTVPPAPATFVTVDSAFQSAFVTWTNPSDSDLASAEVRLHTADGTVAQTVSTSARPSTRGTVTIANLLKGTSYYVLVTALDGSGNRATAARSTNFTTAGGISVSDLTPGLDLITTVTALPNPTGYTGPKTVFLQNMGLYVYKDGKWVSSSAGEIEDGSITGAKLVNGAVTADKLNAAFGGGNMVRNPSFENSTSGFPPADGFTLYNNAQGNGQGFDCEWGVIDEGRTGGKALRVAWNNHATWLNGFYFVGNNASMFKPNIWYVISFYAKAAGAAVGQNMGTAWNAQPNDITPIGDMGITADWKRYAWRVRWTSNPVDANGFFGVTPSGGAGLVVFDDVMVQEGQYPTEFAASFLPGEVVTRYLADNSISSIKVQTDAIKAINIAKDAVTADKIEANAVTSSKILAGSIISDKIAANAITTSKLLVSDFTNYAENNNFSAGNVGWDFGGAALVTNPDRAYQGSNLAYIANGAAVMRNKALMSVKPGDALYAFAMVNQTANGPTASGNTYVRMSGVNAANVEIWTNVGQRAVATGNSNRSAYQKLECSDIVPLNVVAVRVEVICYTGPGEVHVGMAGLMRRATGELVVDGAITTGKLAADSVTASKIFAGSVTTSKLDANAVTADKVAANAITANKLVISSRPVSVVGINIRVVDNIVYWNNGKITYPDDAGNYVTRDIVAGGTGWNGGWNQPVNLCFNADITGPQSLGVYYTSDVTSGVYGKQIPLATWNNGNDFQVKSGTSTIITGGQILTESVNADRLMARTITADRMVLGTLTAAQIATGALTARVLAIGNPDNIIPDSDYRDANWWTGNSPDARVAVEDVSFIQFQRALAIRPNGGIDIFSPHFPVELGATYKLVMGIDLAGDFNGNVAPIIHMPGHAWYSPLVGGGVGDPGGVSSSYTAPGTSLTIERIIENPMNINCRTWQIRTLGSWSGTVRIALRIVRVSDTTLIKDGAITTDKITVGTLNGDRIKTNTLDAAAIRADSILAGSVRVGETSLTSIKDTAIGAAANGGSNVWLPNSNASYYTITGSKIVKTGGPNDWEQNIYTAEMYKDACVVSGRMATDGTFIGLSEGVRGGNYATLNYSFHRSGNGNTYIYENGAQVQHLGENGPLGMDAVNVYVMYDGKSIKYYRNEQLVREIVSSAGRQFVGTVAQAQPGAVVDRLNFVSGTDNSLIRTDPASRINQFTTTIDPGKILISGGTTLANWRHGGDNTQISGGAIGANTISANKLTIGNRGISTIGLNFEWNPTNNYVYWSEGYMYFQDDAGNAVVEYIPAGNTGGAYAHLFFYWVRGTGQVRITRSENEAYGGTDRVMLGSWWGGSNLNMTYGGTIINGDRITTKTISADRLSVSSLSAITANIGLLRTAESGARTEITANLITVYDANNVLRVRLGVW
jgi:hypothetical protein